MYSPFSFFLSQPYNMLSFISFLSIDSNVSYLFLGEKTKIRRIVHFGTFCDSKKAHLLTIISYEQQKFGQFLSWGPDLFMSVNDITHCKRVCSSYFNNMVSISRISNANNQIKVKLVYGRTYTVFYLIVYGSAS